MNFKKIIHSISRWKLLLVSVLLAHIFLKGWALPHFEVHGDDAFSIFYAQQDLQSLLEVLNKEANPPLYFLLLHFWIKLFGIGPIAVKSLSVLLSLGTAAGMVGLAKQLKNLGMGIFMSGCFLLSNLHLEFSQEVRAFQLVLLLTVCSFWLYFSYFQKARNWKLLLLILVSAALPYSHYNAVLVPVFQAVGALLFIRKNKIAVFRLWGSLAVAALLFLPQLFVFKDVVPDEGFWLSTATWSDFTYVHFKLWGNDGIAHPALVVYYLLPVLAFAGKRFQFLSDHFDWRTFWVLWGWFFVPLLVNFIVGTYVPAFRLRYVLFTSLGLYASIGYMLGMLRLQMPKWILIAVAVGHFAYRYSPDIPKNECWEETAQVISHLQEQGASVIVCAGYKRRDLAYYIHRDAFADYKHLNSKLDEQGIFAAFNATNLPDQELLTQHDKLALVLIHNKTVDPEASLEKALDDRFDLCQSLGDGRCARIKVYNTGKEPCFDLQTTASSLDNTKETYHWQVENWKDRMSGMEGETRKLFPVDNNVTQLSAERPFSPSFKAMASTVQRVDISTTLTHTSSPAGMLVVSVEKNGRSIDRSEYYLKQVTKNGTGTISVSKNLNDYEEGAELKVYYWNPEDAVVTMTELEFRVWGR